MDFAVSSDPAVQRQLDRLVLHPAGTDPLALGRIRTLLDRVGNPERRLPPVLHIAGTNGKGSTCAFLRAMLEAGGHRVHVYTSPHLVRFNERIRIAGRLIDDALLADLLRETLDAGKGLDASFFEIATAAALLAFARHPADACILEVGLGGRLDATNVVPRPAACAIAALGIDHQSFLGDTLEAIAAEKAGIARAGVPLVTLAYPAAADRAVDEAADDAGTARVREGEAWRLEGQVYSDANGELALPAPSLPGAHQLRNAALAVAILRHQRAIPISEQAMLAGVKAANWPARLQRLRPGPLIGSREVWLDGGHNPSAAEALAAAFADRGRPHLILGMLENKDADAFLRILAPVVSGVTAVPIPGHAHHAPRALAEIASEQRLMAHTADTLEAALARSEGPSLIAGSLYLAGLALSTNEELPT